MNPREHIGKAFDASSSANGGNPSLKSKGVEESSSTKGDHKADQMNMDMADVSSASQEEGWEVYGKKSKKRAGSSGRGTITTASGPKPWGSSPNAPRSWGQSDGLPRQRWGANGGTARTSGSNWAQANASHRPASKVNPKQQPTSKGLETQHMALPPVIPSQLQHGWNWAARGDFSGSQPKSDEFISNHLPQNDSSGGCDSDSNAMAQKSGDVLDDDDDDLVEDSDDNFSDGYDSDASQKTHKTRKKSKPFRGFFEDLDKLTNEEINEQMRQWHCPACHNGPGEIVWYKCLQPLLTHANTKRAARVKLHQELALLLEEELRHRGTSPVRAGEVFGKWKGLQETTTDREIVWPPMVVIMNTLLEQDENEMKKEKIETHGNIVGFYSLQVAIANYMATWQTKKMWMCSTTILMMDYQEKFFNEQIEKIRNNTEEKEWTFEKLLQAERAKVAVLDVDSGTNEDRKTRKEETGVKGVEEFEAEREKLIRSHEQNKVLLRREYLSKEVELEKEFEAALTELMEKYTPTAFPASNCNS